MVAGGGAGAAEAAVEAAAVVVWLAAAVLLWPVWEQEAAACYSSQGVAAAGVNGVAAGAEGPVPGPTAPDSAAGPNPL